MKKFFSVLGILTATVGFPIGAGWLAYRVTHSPTVPQPMSAPKAAWREPMAGFAVGLRHGVHGGTGVLKTAGGRTFCWTVWHLVAIARDKETGAYNTLQLHHATGEYPAKVVRCSKHQELALLELETMPSSRVTSASFAFYEPASWAEVYHRGCFLGSKFGALPTKGHFSRRFPNYLNEWGDNLTWDLYSLPAYPGSSGGPICDSDGKVLGLAQSVKHVGITFAVPATRIREWARRVGVSFAVEANVAVPSQRDLQRLPVEVD